ncbi:MAG: amidase domain protein [Gemmatimonadetes bacterium]|jgi:Asp-tRNA(Asn)/Glu-tRNA(Gln) amidotransferase A subunit family amidase|nr:amidase domain protein [Gemmatimonadota bacterium]
MSDDTLLGRGHDRRRFLAYFSSIGLGGTLLPGVLWAQVAQGAEITPETIKCAEELAGVSFTDEQRKQMVDSLKDQDNQIEQLHKIPLDNAVAPAIDFDPLPPGAALPTSRKRPMVRSRVAVRTMPGNLEELAFLPVTELSELVRRRKVTSMQLTEMYLGRIRRYDPVLQAVITVTDDRARRQARAADEEIARGRYRGPLHGIPWGAKDLLAVKGYRTTWGAGPFRNQVIDADAAVVQRLDAAGAVLIAKLTLGELAQGDIWFGGTTKNPWNVAQGSSGSSAGPGSAVAAGLVGFAIGTETLGSISSPATRNGVTGLRPTFGRVPRTGAMALSWTMDKIGPMARSVEDCALVLDAIHGPDGHDRTVKDVAFNWDAGLRPSRLRIGYFKSAFDLPERNERGQVQHGTKRFDDAALAVMRTLGAELVPVEVPDINYGAMRLILVAEAAAAFDELTRTGRDRELVQQTPRDWANTFRTARFIPAVDYVNANRVRMLALQKWHELFQTVDVIVTPTGAAGQLVATNFTGHPAVILPSGFRDTSATDTTQVPVSLTFLGGLYQEAQLLAVAKAWQDRTAFHRKTPVVKV